MRLLRLRLAAWQCEGTGVFAAQSDGDSCRRCAATISTGAAHSRSCASEPYVVFAAPVLCTCSTAKTRVFPPDLHSPLVSASTGRMEPKHPHGSSLALLAQVPLATLRESLFVSARASARERAQRVPTRAVKDAQDSHGPRSLVRSSPAPRSTPIVYPGAPKGSL